MSSRTSSSIGETVGAPDEALDQLGGVGAPAADDRDLDAHATLPGLRRAARPVTGLDTIAYNVISNPFAAQDPARPAAVGLPRTRTPVPEWPASASSSVPCRSTTRSTSTCARRSTTARGTPGDRLPTERELAAALRLQPHHGPPRAERARPRGPDRADPGPRHDRPAAAHRARAGRQAELHRGDDPPRADRLHAARDVPAGVGRRGGGHRARDRAGLAGPLHRAAATRRRRAGPARAGLPLGRAVPRPAGPRPGARLVVRGPRRRLRHAGRPDPRIPARPCCWRPARPGCSRATGARRPCSSKASPRPPTIGRSSTAGPTSGAIARATRWSVRSPGHPGPDRRRNAPWRSRQGRRMDMRPSVARSPGRRWRSHDMHARAWRFAAIFAILAVILAACTSSTSSSAPSASSAAVASAPAESSVAPSAEASAPAASEAASGAPSPVITPLPNNSTAAQPGDTVIRWYCCLGTGDDPAQVEVEQKVADALQRGEPRDPPAVRGLRLRLGARRALGPARPPATGRTRRPARHRRRQRLPQPVARSAAAHRQEQVRHERVPAVDRRSLQRRRGGAGRHPVRDLSLGVVLQVEPVQGGRPRRAAAHLEQRVHDARRHQGAVELGHHRDPGQDADRRQERQGRHRGGVRSGEHRPVGLRAPA